MIIVFLFLFPRPCSCFRLGKIFKGLAQVFKVMFKMPGWLLKIVKIVMRIYVQMLNMMRQVLKQIHELRHEFMKTNKVITLTVKGGVDILNQVYPLLVGLGAAFVLSAIAHKTYQMKVNSNRQAERDTLEELNMRMVEYVIKDTPNGKPRRLLELNPMEIRGRLLALQDKKKYEDWLNEAREYFYHQSQIL